MSARGEPKSIYERRIASKEEIDAGELDLTQSQERVDKKLLRPETSPLTARSGNSSQRGGRFQNDLQQIKDSIREYKTRINEMKEDQDCVQFAGVRPHTQGSTHQLSSGLNAGRAQTSAPNARRKQISMLTSKMPEGVESGQVTDRYKSAL